MFSNGFRPFFLPFFRNISIGVLYLKMHFWGLIWPATLFWMVICKACVLPALGFLMFFPRIFVWGSCFWFCVPPGLRLLLPRCRLTPSFTHNLVPHHLSHTTLSHAIFRAQLGHTPSFTYNFVTHHLSHTTLSHTIFQLSHTLVQACHLWHWVALVARLGPLGRAVTPRHFAWQAWHLATSTVGLRGRRGTWRHLPSFWRHQPSFRVAGMAHMALGWLWWHACGPSVARWRRDTLRGRRGTWRHLPSFRVAGLALGDIYRRFGDIDLRFAWQACHLWHWAGSGGTLGAPWSRGDAAALCVAGVALRHLPSFRGTYGTGLALVARLGPLGRAVAPWHFAWQAWHLATSTVVVRGRRGTWPYVSANELVVSDLPNSFSSHLSFSPILPVWLPGAHELSGVPQKTVALMLHKHSEHMG